MKTLTVTVLGARGSVPVSGSAYARYGCATTSVLVQTAGTDIVLDAGTGIMNLPADVLEKTTLNLLLTHAHLDHLNGLSMCPFVLTKGNEVHVRAAYQKGEPLSDVLKELYAPPIWPVTPDNFSSAFFYHTVAPEFEVGDIRVRCMAGVHPGGVTLYRLSAQGKSFVFATDCTLTEKLYPRAVEFAKGCDLLLVDGQYVDEEWPMRSGFGHNTWKRAAQLAGDCGAKVVRIVHHDPTHTDDFLDAINEDLRAINPEWALAREGEVITL